MSGVPVSPPSPDDGSNSSNDDGGWVLGFMPRRKSPDHSKEWKPLPDLPYDILMAAAKYPKEKQRIEKLNKKLPPDAQLEAFFPFIEHYTRKPSSETNVHVVDHSTEPLPGNAQDASERGNSRQRTARDGGRSYVRDTNS